MYAKMRQIVKSAEQIKKIKCMFLVMILGVSVLICYFLNSFHQAVFVSFAGLRSYKQVSFNTKYSFTEGDRLVLDGYKVPIAYNTTIRRKDGITSIQQGQNKSKNGKLVELNVIPKRYFLCNGPTGRLGNQLFDFASSLGISSTLNYRFVMPSTHPLLKYFEINHPVLVEKPENLRTITLQQWRNEWWGSNGTYLAFNLTLSGYYRVWNYFRHVTNAVKKSLTIKDQFLDKAKQFLQLNTSRNRALIGIHVRRGDFLKTGQQKYGKAVASKNYITTAMTYFQKKNNDSFFVVVSDDKNWCKNNLAGQDVVVSENKEAIVDLAIMTLCNHTIITSGTFGWWGGWLSGGEVVYWTGFTKPGSKNEKNILFRGDYYLPHWTGIDTD